MPSLGPFGDWQHSRHRSTMSSKLSRLLSTVALVALAVAAGAAPTPQHQPRELRLLSSRFIAPDPFYLHKPGSRPGESTATETPAPIADSASGPSQTPTSTIFITDGRPAHTSSPSPNAGTGAGLVPEPPPALQSATLGLGDGLVISQGLLFNASSPLWDSSPSAEPDVPITVVFLVLFLAGAAMHGRKSYRAHKRMKGEAEKKRRARPILAYLVLAFCILRVLACVLRIILATQPGDRAALVAEMITIQIG